MLRQDVTRINLDKKPTSTQWGWGYPSHERNRAAIREMLEDSTGILNEINEQTIKKELKHDVTINAVT